MMTEGPSRPRDANQLAKRIVDLATGAETEEKTAPLTPAQEFARSGGLKGGAARAASNRDDPIKQRIFQQPALMFVVKAFKHADAAAQREARNS